MAFALAFACYSSRNLAHKVPGCNGAAIYRHLDSIMVGGSKKVLKMQENPPFCSCHNDQDVGHPQGQRDQGLHINVYRPLGKGGTFQNGGRCGGIKGDQGGQGHQLGGRGRLLVLILPYHGAFGEAETGHTLGNH